LAAESVAVLAADVAPLGTLNDDSLAAAEAAISKNAAKAIPMMPHRTRYRISHQHRSAFGPKVRLTFLSACRLCTIRTMRTLKPCTACYPGHGVLLSECIETPEWDIGHRHRAAAQMSGSRSPRE
jgi:hypothetical protein